MEKQRFWSHIGTYLKYLTNLTDHIDLVAAKESIRDNVPFRGPNVYILFAAIMMASLGLNVNSIPVIIGAMLISPLMGPIMGFGLSLATSDTEMMKFSLKNLGTMVLISVFASTLYFMVSPLDMENPTELLARTNPTIYDVLIAFFGGFAGILEMSRKRQGTVISGVAIATALMPPLCTVGYGISQLNLHYTLGALYLFFINTVFIALATWLMVKYLHYPVVKAADEHTQKRMNRMITIVTLVMIVPSIISGYMVVRDNNFNRNANKLIAAHRTIGKSYVYDYKINHEVRPATIEVFLAGEKLDDLSRERMYTDAAQYGIMKEQLIFNEKAALDNLSLDKEAFVKDIFADNAQQIKERDERIKELEGQINSYEESRLPFAQIAEEIRSQYPVIGDVTIARGRLIPTGQGELVKQVIVVVHEQEDKPLSPEDLERMQAWLRIRLNNDNALVLTE